MTQVWAYVGKLGPEGKLDWGGTYSGNIPTSGWLPDLGSDAASKIMDLADIGKFEGRQLDWGA